MTARCSYMHVLVSVYLYFSQYYITILYVQYMIPTRWWPIYSGLPRRPL